MGGKRIEPNDIIGQRFERLVVTKYLGFYNKNGKGNKEHYYNAKCDCGNMSQEIMRRNLQNGISKSCGCIHREGLLERITTHGLSKHRLYEIYNGMKKRCLNGNDENYKYYGGRGISICNEWLGENGFINFYNWSLENGYDEKLTIDRKNVDGNYEPKNCRWSTMKEQVINRRKDRKPVAISPNGDTYEIDCLEDFINENNFDRFTVYKCLNGEYRQHNGWQFKYITNNKENDYYGKQ